jgi:beta-lactamase class A
MFTARHWRGILINNIDGDISRHFLKIPIFMAAKTLKKIFSAFAVPALLILSGWFANDWYAHHFHPPEKRIKRSGFLYISPLLDVELPEGYNVRHEPIPFKHRISKYVEQQIQSGIVRDMSVYYRDLSDGPWFGINEKVKYNPASMMKVPVMIAWLKRAEKDKSVLRHKMIFNEKNYQSPPQNIKSEQSLKSGASYTVEELLRYMMYYSDNNAMSLLYYSLPPEEFSHVVDSMDVANEEYGKYESISVHGYSGFLRILYNASFLNEEMSEKALELMSYQDFPEGLVAGVPKGVKVASKFGEYNDRETPDIIQLHEFGIVYHPKGPYILGVLTRGNDWKKQADIIKSVSELVYKSVDVTIDGKQVK